MKQKGFFITGTDTGVGKTRATLYLMRALQAGGRNVIGMKPVATGGQLSEGRWVNADAVVLQSAGSVRLPYDRINPVLYPEPACPEIAARKEGRSIELGRIVEACRELGELADFLLVEGIGGWRVPLNERETVADLARVLGFPVILVVGLRLGCLNHGLLSQEAIVSSGCRFAGWVANHVIRDFAQASENVRVLQTAFRHEPLLTLPYREGSDDPGTTGLQDGEAAKILLTLTP